MDRIATPNLLVLFASFFLWSAAVQATFDPPSRWEGLASSDSSVDPELAASTDSPAHLRVGAERLVEEGILTAASGHWF